MEIESLIKEVRAMKTVEIDGVRLTEEQITKAYKKLQEPEFEYPMWFKSLNNEYIVRFDAPNKGEVVRSGSDFYNVGLNQSNWIKHTNKRFWTQVDEPVKYERPRTGYAVFGDGISDPSLHKKHYANFNLYATSGLAEKASKLMKESNKLIMACLLVDPDYVPDWSDDSTEKCTVYFSTREQKFAVTHYYSCIHQIAYVSTKEKAEEVCKLMNSWRGL